MLPAGGVTTLSGELADVCRGAMTYTRVIPPFDLRKRGVNALSDRTLRLRRAQSLRAVPQSVGRRWLGGRRRLRLRRQLEPAPVLALQSIAAAPKARAGLRPGIVRRVASTTCPMSCAPSAATCCMMIPKTWLGSMRRAKCGPLADVSPTG